MNNSKGRSSTSIALSLKRSTTSSQKDWTKIHQARSANLLVTDRFINKHMSPSSTGMLLNGRDIKSKELERQDWSEVFRPFLNTNNPQNEQPGSSPNAIAKVKLLLEKVVSDSVIRTQIQTKSSNSQAFKTPGKDCKNIHKSQVHIEMGTKKLSPLHLKNQRSNFQVKIKPKSGMNLAQKSKHMHWLKQKEEDQIKSKQSKTESLLATLKSEKNKKIIKGTEEAIPTSTMSSSRINQTLRPDCLKHSCRSMSPRVASPNPVTKRFVKEEIAFLKGAQKYTVPNLLPKIRSKRLQGKGSHHMDSAIRIVVERFDKNHFALLSDISFKEKSQIALDGAFRHQELLQESTIEGNPKKKEGLISRRENLVSSRFFMESSLRAVQSIHLNEDMVDEFRLAELNKGDLNILKRKISNLLVDIFIRANPLFERLSNLSIEEIVPFLECAIKTIEQHIKRLNEAIAGLSKTINVSALFWELLNFEKHDFVLSDERHRQFLSMTPDKIFSDRRAISFNLINIFRVFYHLHFDSQDQQLFSTIEISRMLNEIELYLNVNVEKFQDRKITPRKLFTEEKIRLEDFLILSKITDLTLVERTDSFLACIADYTFDLLMFSGFRAYIAFHENPEDDGTRYRNLIYEFLFNNKKNVVLESILLELTRVRGLIQ